MSDENGSTQQIADALRRAIIEQGIGPGTRLPEDTIGERFGVSRTVVRSALTELVAEGLVERRRNRGAIVAEPSWNEARDTFDVRIAVEEIVVKRLAGTLTEDQVAELRAHVSREEKAANKDEVHSIRLAGEFHTMLAQLTGSEVLTKHMRELVSRCCLVLAVFARPHSSECGVSEHRALIDLLVAGDGERAAAAMHNHLGDVAERALILPPKRDERPIGDILSDYASG
jgi:DNA-binding GntR family transcriptional regulator